MMPTFDQPAFVVKGNMNVNNGFQDVQVSNIDQQFKSGYRVIADLSLPSFLDLSFRYTSFDQPLTGIKTSPISDLTPAFGLADTLEEVANSRGFGEIREAFDLDSFDALATLYTSSTNCIHWSCFGGFKVLRMSFVETLDFNDADNAALNITYQSIGESTAFGVGPQIGLRGKASLWRCLSFCSRLQIGGLSRSIKNKQNYTLNDRVTPADNRDYRISTSPKRFWVVVGNYEWNLGFQLASTVAPPFCKGHRLPFVFEGGYEFLSISNLINRVTSVDDIREEMVLNTPSDFTLQGPYIKCRLAY